MRLIHLSCGPVSSRTVGTLSPRGVHRRVRRGFRGRLAFVVWGAAGSVALSACVGTSPPGVSTAGPVPVPAPAAPAAPTVGPAGERLMIWLTGYSWQDNTPPGSSVVGEPVVHQQAAGTGTYRDPITVAVPGHDGAMDWPPGTRFYLPSVQRYVIVEDSGAAKPPPGAQTHLDMWIDGRDGTKQTSDDCASQFTGDVPAVLNPPEGLPVMTGAIHSRGRCNIPPQPEDLGSYDRSSGDGE